MRVFDMHLYKYDIDVFTNPRFRDLWAVNMRPGCTSCGFEN